MSQEWNPIVSQINAIVATVGATIGALRAKGVLTPDEEKMIFILARSLLPEAAGADGVKTIQAMEITAENIGS